ncbi:MAG: response regulator transcription factor [Verrucomicrobiales bacterium]|jgi:DNA-binding response OmpR family regulator|nr:response regulator transcription factor [Verrucomicrobiales bacterium]
MSSPYRILVVEDDPALLRGISDNFRHHGFLVDVAEDGEVAIDRAIQGSPDLVVLDVMLPKVNGYEVCRYLRQEGFQAPILFLTAKAEEPDVLLGLGLGGDDYVVKPFRIRELIARIEAILRRSVSNESTSFENPAIGSFSFDRDARKLRREDGETVPLSPKEYDLLDFFLQNRGKALSREQIMREVWGLHSQVTFRSIDRFVTQLRKIIENSPGEHIETIREYGYRLRVGQK